jgi:hypothetical protein
MSHGIVPFMKYPPLFTAALSAAVLWFAPRAPAAPPNDNFASATVISAASGSSGSVNTSTATVEPGEPAHAGITGGHSIWYRFTPAVKDRFSVNTGSSSFDTTLAAYSGNAVNALIELASNDDIDPGSNSRSRVEFTAGPANPVQVAIDGYDGASGSATLAWSPATLANDSFSAAKTLTGSVGSTTGFNFRATGETGEPNTGNSVWYKWTVPVNARATVKVVSTGMAPFVGIYTGASVGALTEVAVASGAANTEVTAAFDTVATTVYRIQVKGSTGGAADFVLTWSLAGDQNFPLLPDIVSLADDPEHFMYGWYLDQNQLAGRTLLRVTTATANVGSGPLELRGSSSNPAVYQRIFNADGTWTDRLAGTFTFHPSHGHLHFDDWLQFHIRAVTAGDGVGEIVASGDKTSFSIFDLEAHDLSLPGAPSNNVYSGGLVQGISVGWRDVYRADLMDQWIDVTNVPPGRYWLESVVDPDNRVQELDEANNTNRIIINYSGTAPPNNNFGSATVLTGLTAGTTGRTYAATKENGEPLHAGNAGGASVWYRWVAPTSGQAVISTEGSGFDTLLGVYTGSSVSGLTAVASNDNDGALSTSRVTFTAVSGITYRIAVDGKNNGAGASAGVVEIAINPAINDNFGSAVVLAGGSGTAGGSTRRSTAEDGEPAHAGNAAATSIWYSWTATMTGDAVFNTEGSVFDARLAVYTGGAMGALTSVASAVSSGYNSPATAILHVNSGTVYRIAVDGAEGLVKLNWQVATSIAPYVITQPVSRNVPQGANLDIAAVIGGSPLLSYQWKFGGNPVSNGDKFAGADTATLTVKKLDFADSGAYTLTAVNPSGTVTTNPASLIVLTNPRTASVNDSPGDIGGSVFAPVVFNASGDEHVLQFTLLFDPAVLSNGQITAGPDAAGAGIVLDRSMEGAGSLGVTVTLPGSGVFTAGLKNLLTARFTVAPAAAPNSVTVLGFGDAPVTKSALSVSGGVLPVVFDAGNVTLGAVQATISSAPAPAGTTTLTVRGLRGATYQLLRSTDMVAWTVVDSALIGPTGIVSFTASPSGSKAFYKAAPAP